MSGFVIWPLPVSPEVEAVYRQLTGQCKPGGVQLAWLYNVNPN